MRFRVLFVCLLPAVALAQTQANTGQIEGTVTDPAGAAIAAAKVRLRNVDTNLGRETATNAAGLYRAALLPIGNYEVTVEAPGFALYRQTGIELSTGQVLTVNVRMALSATQQEITVTADAALVETAQTTTSRAVNEIDIENLPNLSRSELNFAFLQPFINGNRPREYEAPRLDIGGLARRVNYQVDGFQNSAAQQKSYRVIIFSTAALQETQISSLGANAETGRTGGGVVNNIIRSGTNQFRGQASYWTSRKVWNARPFGAREGIKPSGNVWVGAIGGPIRKDRLFFFASYEASRRAFPQSLGFTSDAARAAAARLGFTGEEIDVLPSRFNPQLWLAKFDWRPNTKHSLSLRANTFRELFAARDPGGLTVLSSSNGAIFNEAAVAFAWTATFNPTTVTEFRWQLADRFSRRRPVVEPGPNTPPRTVVSGSATFGYPSGLTANREKIVEWSGNVTKQFSRHQFKSGFNVVLSPLNFEDQLIPTFTFGGLTASGPRGAVSAVDQYLYTIERRIDPATNRPFTYTQLSLSFGERLLRYHQVYYGMYAQDSWRPKPNVTVNYGMRWETQVPPEIDATAPHPLSRQFPVDKTNFAPRFGIAWAPRGSEKTAVRFTYGIHFDSPQSNYFRDSLVNNGQRRVSITISGTTAGAPVYPNYPTTAAGLAIVRPSITVIDPTLTWMYVHQSQLSIQRQLTRNTVMTLTGAFTKGTKIPVVQNVNLAPAVGTLLDGRNLYSSARIDPQFNNINMITAGGNSNYAGLGVNLNRRWRRGMQFNLSYTWSHALDNAPESGISGGSEQPQDSYNRRAEYGNSLTDVRHVLNGSAVLLPQFKNRFLANNQYAFFFFARSGSTFDVRSGTDLNRDSVNNDRPYFFGRNTGKGPSSYQFDFRYSRLIPLGKDRRRLSFSAEAANILNHPVPDSTNAFINRTYGTGDQPIATFRDILAWHEMRRIQMGLRFDF